MSNSLNCTYCGAAFPSDKDHVIPASYTYGGKHRYPQYQWVWSCKLCNTTLSNKTYLTVQLKADYLLGRFRQRFRHELRFPDWTTEELDEVSPRLAKVIRSKLAKREGIRERIYYLRRVAEIDVEIQEEEVAAYILKDSKYLFRPSVGSISVFGRPVNKSASRVNSRGRSAHGRIPIEIKLQRQAIRQLARSQKLAVQRERRART